MGNERQHFNALQQTTNRILLAAIEDGFRIGKVVHLGCRMVRQMHDRGTTCEVWPMKEALVAQVNSERVYSFNMPSLHIKGEVIVRKHHVSIEAQLDEAHTVLTNIRSNPMLLQALAAYGYSEARLAEGEALHEAALAFYQEKIKAYGMLRRISDTNSSAVQQTKYLYSQHVKMTRVALDRNPGALQMLSAAGGQKKTVVAWIVQAQHFYTSALADSDILGQLNTFGLSRTILEEGASRVAALSAARAAYRQQRAIAQHATSQRDKALLALASWVHDLKQIARIVLRNTPQLLEQIGIAAKS